MGATKKAFRLIVVRRGTQVELFEDSPSPYRYTVVASNRDESATATMAWYCQGGEVSAVFFRLSVLAYNLFKGFTQLTLIVAWRRHQVQTLRWRLYQAAGKIVRHAGQRLLKINTAMAALFESVRHRCWALAVRVSGAT